MKRSELKQLIREVIEEEFVRSPANHLDNVLGNASKEQLKDKNFIVSSIVSALKNAQFLDTRTFQEIKTMLDWKGINTNHLTDALKMMKAE
jgi:hypothetical protein